MSGEQIFAQCYGPTGDCDGDGVPDHLDFDDNNNGILDSTECPITYINFSSITSVTPLVPGDSPQVFTKFLDGINLPTSITIEAPSHLIGNDGNISIFSKNNGSLLRFEDSNTADKDHSFNTSIIFDSPVKIRFGANSTIGVSNITYADQFEFTADGVSSDFEWIVLSSSYANISVNGATITVSGTSTDITNFAEFDVYTNIPIGKIDINYLNLQTESLNSGQFVFSMCRDSDFDGFIDGEDFDSDNDGCSDANEAYGSNTADGGDTGFYGTGTPTLSNFRVDANGLVISAGVTGAAYNSSPVSSNVSSSLVNYHTATSVFIDFSALSSKTIFSGTGTSFTITAATASSTNNFNSDSTPNYSSGFDSSSGLVFQWQEDGIDLTDGGVYSGSTSIALSLSNVVGLDGKVYNLVVSHLDNVCFLSQSSALLTVIEPCSSQPSDPTLNAQWLAADCDLDGITNSIEDDVDTDGDGIANFIDLDSDDDGVLDASEGGLLDTDGDGTLNFLDDDDDGDGILTSTETATDTDDDSIPDYLDLDSDGDAITDTIEGETDTDLDGIPNYLDLDSDNDGLLDSTELNINDEDYDGISDYLDPLAAGFLASPIYIVVNESGTVTSSVLVELNRKPTSDVVISILVYDSTEVSIGTTTLTFTPSNWNTQQLVLVTGVDDFVRDADVMSNLIFSVVDAQSDDDFDSLSDQIVQVTTQDDDPEICIPRDFNDADFEFILDATHTPGSSVYTLTPEEGHKRGMVWFQNKLDLRVSFSLNVEVFLGNDDSGADGIAFVIQNISTNEGSTGGGLGYNGISPSFAIEIDTYYNGWDTTSEDHIAFVENGNADNAVSDEDLTAVDNLENGEWHNIEINWNPVINELSYVFSRTGGNIYINSKTIDIIEVLSSNIGYWGFTAATGAALNIHEVRFDNNSICVTDEILMPTASNDVASSTLQIICANGPPKLNDLAKTDARPEGVDPRNDLMGNPYNLVWYTSAIGTTTYIPNSTFLVDGATYYVESGNLSDPNDISYRQSENRIEVVVDLLGGTYALVPPNLNLIEGTTTATFSLVLNDAPLSSVTYDLASSDTNQLVVSTASMTFTPSNWNVPQVGTLTTVDNLFADGAQSSNFTVRINDPLSDDCFNNPTPLPTYAIQIADDEIAGFLLSPVSGNCINSNTSQINISGDFTSTSTGNYPIVSPFMAINGSGTGVVGGVFLSTVSVSLQLGFGDVFERCELKLNLGNTGQFDDGLQISIDGISLLNFDQRHWFSMPEFSGGGRFDTNLDGTWTPWTAEGTPQLEIINNSIKLTILTTNGNREDALPFMDSTVVDWVLSSNFSYDCQAGFNLVFGNQNGGGGPGSIDALLQVEAYVNPCINLIENNPQTASVSVVLTAQPLNDVIIDMQSLDLTEVTVGSPSLTFTPLNWNIAQTVILNSVDELIVDGSQTVSITASINAASHSGFTGLASQTVTAVNVDNDIPGYTLSSVSGILSEANTYSNWLTNEPNDVDVENFGMITNGGKFNDLPNDFPGVVLALIEFNYIKASLAGYTKIGDFQGHSYFKSNTDSDWFQAKATAESLGGYLITIKTEAENEFILNNADVEVIGCWIGLYQDTCDSTYSEPAGGWKWVDGTLLPYLDQTQTASFTVVLDSQPLTDVILNLTITPTDEISTSVSSVSFTNSDWNTPQVITVSNFDDSIIDGTINSSITFSVDAASNSEFLSLAPQAVVVPNLDNEIIGFSIGCNGGGSLQEGSSGTVSFTVVLNVQPNPGDIVILDISSLDLTEVDVDSASTTRVFTDANWNIPQTVILNSVDDLILDGTTTSNINIAVNSLSPVAFSSLASQTIAVQNLDDDVSGFQLSEVIGVLTEALPSKASFEVILTVEPLSNVQINLNANDTSEVGVAAPSFITFTPATWNVSQTVTLNQVDEFIVDGDQISLVTASIDAGSDLGFLGLPSQSVTVTTLDNDVAGITIIVQDNLSSETGDTAEFTVQLDVIPSADVTFDLGTTNSDEAVPGVSQVTFTPMNWNIPQTILVNGINDSPPISDGSQTVTITTTNIASLDTNFAILTDAQIDDVLITNQDDDAPGIVLSLLNNNFNTSESGGTVTVFFELLAQPAGAADVIVPLSLSTNTDEVTLSANSISISAANWNNPTANQITLTGVDDFIIDGTMSIILVTGDPSSTETIHDNLTAADVANLTIYNLDNDSPGLIISNPEAVSENASTTSFTVALATSISTSMTIQVTANDPNELFPTISNLYFTPSNWNIPQTVLVIGVDDDVIDGDVTTIISLSIDQTAYDPFYLGLPNQIVSIINIDNDFDQDGDGVFDAVDNCLQTANSNQTDLDGDGIGDVCDLDVDGDGVLNSTELSDNTDSYLPCEFVYQSITVPVLGKGDCDSDGVIDSIDLDDDNDGILDTDELFEDLDLDGIPNTLDLDSDADGCFDVLEALYSDADEDGVLGTGIPAVDALGRVLNFGGYETPPDNNNNTISDYKEVGEQFVLESTLEATTLFSSNQIILSVSVSAESIAAYQWQINNGTEEFPVWENISESNPYSGTLTNQLIISQASESIENKEFRVLVNNLFFVCQEALISSTQIRSTDLIIPNAFSPDGDGINDTWEIQGLDVNGGYTLTVFNRWQNVVYRTTQYENDWAGNPNNTSSFSADTKLSDGTYFYWIEWEDSRPETTGYVYIKRKDN